MHPTARAGCHGDVDARKSEDGEIIEWAYAYVEHAGEICCIFGEGGVCCDCCVRKHINVLPELVREPTS